MELRPLKDLPFIEGPGPIQDAEKFARRLIAFYDVRARWHRRFYRISGILVILAGVALPVLTSLDYKGKDLLVSLIGVVVAAATALRGFYRWDQSWILLRGTEILITGEYLSWRSGVLAAHGHGEDPPSTEVVQRLLESLCQARVDESGNFFRNISFPSGESQQTTRPASGQKPT